MITQAEYNHGYHKYDGQALRHLQEIYHSVEPTAHTTNVRKTVVSGYTPFGMMRRFFGFFI